MAVFDTIKAPGATGASIGARPLNRLARSKESNGRPKVSIRCSYQARIARRAVGIPAAMAPPWTGKPVGTPARRAAGMAADGGVGGRCTGVMPNALRGQESERGRALAERISGCDGGAAAGGGGQRSVHGQRRRLMRISEQWGQLGLSWRSTRKYPPRSLRCCMKRAISAEVLPRFCQVTGTWVR
jgi:hypothetical protein